jgi:hypothetical protein
MSNPDVDLELTSKIVSSPSITCNHCQTNIAEIFQESGEFCLHCWQVGSTLVVSHILT